MMAGFNDSMEDAARLIHLMRGIKSKINLIPYNENPARDIRRPSVSCEGLPALPGLPWCPLLCARHPRQGHLCSLRAAGQGQARRGTSIGRLNPLARVTLAHLEER